MVRCWASTCIVFSMLLVMSTSTVLAQNGQPKPLAPGILKVIPPETDVRTSFSLPMPLPGLDATEYQPNFASRKHTLYGQTRNIVLYRDVWQYEFGFTGLRQAKFTQKDAQGKLKTLNIWYMIYRIRNVGKSLTYEKVKEDPRFEHIKHELKKDTAKEGAEFERNFRPRFTLEGLVVEDNNYERVVYRDKIRPALLRQIQIAEDPNQPLLDTLQMSKAEFPLAKNSEDGGVWGIAIWDNVDPRVDYVSVFISGLTNSYRIQGNVDSTTALGQRTKKRTLQLNFWRPGDQVNQDQDKVVYGIPLVDNSDEQIQICERYNLPGPLIRGYVVSPKATENVMVMEIDAGVSLTTLQSRLVMNLDDEEMPEEISKAFADSGVSIPNDIRPTPLIPGQKWSFTANGLQYVMQLEPQYWEVQGKGIRFIRSLDFLWLYR